MTVPVFIGETPAPLNPIVVSAAASISFPTIGHYIETGFADPGLVRQCGNGRVVGRAITVRTTAQDSTMLHHAAGQLAPGDVLVIDTGGDLRHAPVGQIVATAASLRGAVGIVIDGLLTDTDEVSALGIPTYARGRTILTTKLHGLPDGGLNVPIVCGGVAVKPGDIVLADSNGVLFIPQQELERLLPTVIEDDQDEPSLVRALEGGARMGDETGATATVEALLRAQ